MKALAVHEVQLLQPADPSVEWLTEDAWVLLRVGHHPVGQAHLRALPNRVGRRGIHDAIAQVLTHQHAECALLVAFDAWMRRHGHPEGFSVDAALQALRDESDAANTIDDSARAPRMTVAICSRGRSGSLIRAVAAIADTLREPDELLVVLNAPSDTSAADALTQFPSVRVVVEHRPGLSWARNRAIAEFRGDVLLFTDDDCVPDARWVDVHRTVFARNPDVDIVTGLVEPLSLETAAQQQFEAYGGFPRAYTRRWMAAPERDSAAGMISNLGAGANMAIRRRVFDRIGAFDAALGAGTACQAGDDTEYQYRALKAGLLLASEPNAVVRHEHRRDLVGLHQQVGGWSRGFSCAMHRSALAFPEDRRAFDTLRWRIAWLHHARRMVMTPRHRTLTLAALREMRGSAAWYASARATAQQLAGQQLAGQQLAPAIDAPPHAANAIHGGRVTARVQPVVLTPDNYGMVFTVDPGASHLLVDFVVGSVRVPRVSLRAHYGVIGADRLCDALARAYIDATTVGGWDRAVATGVASLRAMMPGAYPTGNHKTV